MPYAAEGAPPSVRAAVAEEQRDVGRIESLLQRLGLLFGQPAGVDGLVEAVLQRLLQCIGQRVGLDSELCGSIVDDRLALLGGRERGRRRERSDGAEADATSTAVATATAIFVFLWLSCVRSNQRALRGR